MMNAWNPEQYKKFEKERDLPFDDLLQLIDAKSVSSIIDLGCGTGRLTKRLHEALHAHRTLGIDSSKEMLDKSKDINDKGLEFRLEDINENKLTEKFDLIFSNAALQWTPRHHQLFKKLKNLLNPKGQLAIQMPANQEMPSHLLAKELSKISPFKEILGPVNLPSILPIEEYSEILYDLGFKEQKVFIKVYPHLLNSSEDLIEWVKGSLLSYYRNHLPIEVYDQFFKRYRAELLAEIGEHKPYFYPFKRALLWAR